jgi:hypothetical protein
MRQPVYQPLVCRPCRVVLRSYDDVAEHSESAAHLTNEQAWRSWLRIEQAVANTAPTVCSPNFYPHPLAYSQGKDA